LAETLNVANEVLDSKKKSRSSVFSFIEDTRNDIDASGNSSVVNQNSAYRLRMLPLSNSPASAGDICILLCPLEKDSQKKFREKVAALLQNNEIMQFVKDVAQVGDGGILKQLLTMTQGVHIHLPALSLDGNPIPATNLCSRFWGCYILRLSQKQWNLASAPLGRSGVRAIPFATTLQKNKVVFARNKQSSFAIDTRFLHSLNSYKEVCVKLGSESIRPISVRLGEITELHSNSYVASSVTPANSYYRTAVWSVLASVLSLCACGVPYRKQKLTTAIEIPKNLSSNDIGKYLSAVLGLYRAQKELELTSKSNTFVQRNKDASAPMFHIWAVGKKIKTIPNQFSKKRSFVYVVTPPWDEIGLPDFAAFQKTANFVAKLARKGKIRSCRVFSCEKIADGIRQMSGDYTCVFSKNAMFEEDKLPLYILIESRKRLPWQRIGKVRQVDDDSAQIGIDE
jgi:phosphoribosylformylglycinamidine (FGAM) synthase-like enzyme